MNWQDGEDDEKGIQGAYYYRAENLPRGPKIRKNLPLSPARRLSMLVFRLEEGLPPMEP